MLWFEKLMVRFFMSLDTTLFNFIGTLYDLLIAISRTSILTQGDIASFAARIEILLGIFMLFKVSFSLITYVVNPDEFSDKSKGFGKLIQSSVISLVMLVLVPYIFQMAFSLQAKILDDNILAKLLLGEKIQDDGEATIIDTAGNRMAFYVMLPFFSPNYSVEGLSACMNMVDSDGNFSEECRDALESAGLESPNLENYVYGIQNKSLGLTFRTATALSVTNDAEDGDTPSDQHFVIAYHKPLSTVTAVVVCLLLISFCIDIGVRSVKLAFLQLIYPIPVISYMDPKSGKDGMFTKWYKMCLSTFLSLFIRLLALYFGIYIITKVADLGMYDIINGSQITNGWVKIFVIIGVLMFIKQLPKILENMGIKIEGDGKFNLNPLKKVFDENNGIAGAKAIKRTGIAAGAAGLAGAAAFGTNLIARKGNPFSAIAGAVSGARRGLMSGLKGEKLGKAYSSSYSGAMNARKIRKERKSDGVSFYEPIIQKAQETLGLETQKERNEAIAKKNEAIKKNADIIKNAKSTLTGLVEKDPDMDNVRNEKNIWDNMSAETYRKQFGIADLDTAVSQLAARQKKADDDYKNQLKVTLGKHLSDAEVQNEILNINTAIGTMASPNYNPLSTNDINSLWDDIGFTSNNSKQARADSSNAAKNISEATTGKEAQHVSDVAKYVKNKKNS